jgi:Protein of unknown function (DUF2799)
MRSATFGLVSSLLLLGGCATMSEPECLTVDWQTIGFEDGVAGYSGDRIGQHRKACAKHGVSPDLVGYQRGRDAGLREYCQPANGFRVGSHGGSYAGVCPAELDGAFTAAYESGRQLYALESRLSNARNQIVSKRRELERVEDTIVKKTAVIVRSESTGEERAQALVDTKQLAERAGRLKSEIRQLERDQVEYERDLEDYRARVAFIG